MELDAALARALDDGLIPPTIRFYGWRPHALSLGFHQDEEDVDAALLRHSGIDLVRRPTGGKAILHAHEATYCAVVPLEGTSPRAVYTFINACLIRGLALLGVRAELSEAGDDLRTLYRDAASLPCFTSSARSELLVAGRKLVGSAQRKIGGVVLQHGSVLIGPEHRAIAGLLAPRIRDARAAVERDLEAKTTEIESILGRSVTFDEVVRALKAGFAATDGVTLVDAPLPDVVSSTTNAPDPA
jgi:lipoate-protein ligase A